MSAASAKILQEELEKKNVTLVAVSKTKPAQMIQELYDVGIKDFGENRPQEMAEKYELLAKDIKWHMIGNLQKNKVKYIAPFVHLIHSVTSAALLKTINKEAAKNERDIDVLIQIKIAEEDSKSGLDIEEAKELIKEINEGIYPHVNVRGYMGMATFTDDKDQVRSEFKELKSTGDTLAQLLGQNENYSDSDPVLSMGMSGDYKIAIEEGANMVRIGSLLFGSR